ncbi:hypothetical protein GBA65_10585 [Rubrobacter marinus]|uniref:Uncharacterized protein n=1 Tax=Rubrobacter marinus TaxID=2653852 RepID=A0A6G8PXG5_9ACTN|nr:hypothetical protein [Rubrobacter marinus]QIN78893.1 hypothetical protein GBA65_10585 [Rubrobacter marinus]
MALLPGERAGKICTASAGSVSVEALLCARPGEALPSPSLPDCGPRARRYGLREDGGGGTYELACEVRALRGAELAEAVDELLRAVSAHAALVGAVLETRVVRLGEPLVPDPLVLGRLARYLRSSGLGVSFGPSWTPAPQAEAWVGAGGRRREIEHLLREHPSWQPVLP